LQPHRTHSSVDSLGPVWQGFCLLKKQFLTKVACAYVMLLVHFEKQLN
jgi:hypothetical protein